MRRAIAHNPGVSLFPFLAVLICTMGVMMLLLVIINRPGAAAIDDSTPPPDAVFEEGGKGSAATLAAGQGGATAAVNDELQSAREMVQWRVSQLEISREKTIGDLRDERLRLATVEDGMRKLRDQWQLVKKAAGDIEQADQTKDHDKQSIAAFVDRLKSEVNATHERLGKAIQEARSEPPAYAIVPYDGPNGTRRQPIYIECRNDAVVLQPEGIVLNEHDFEGPKGPGNPLASTIRAARDYLAGGTAPTPGREPYPLLIVRSDGIVAFYSARSAMSSWASEFGYELIEADRKLAFQPPNPQLAQVEKAALADARSRYAWFATNHTSHDDDQDSHERLEYRAARTGGIKREGEASLSEDDDPSTGFGSGTSGFGSPNGRSGAGGSGSGYSATGTGAGNGVAGTGYGNGNGNGNGSGYGNGLGSGTGSGNNSGIGNGAGRGVAMAGAPGGGPAYVPGSNYMALPGSGSGGTGYGPAGFGYGNGGTGYGSGAIVGGPGGSGNGSGIGSGIGSGTGAGTGTGAGPGNGLSGGPALAPGNGYMALPGSGGAQGGTGYGTSGTSGASGAAAAGYAGGTGGQTGVPGSGYVGSSGSGADGPASGVANGGMPGGTGNAGGTAPAGYYPAGMQATGYNPGASPSGTNASGGQIVPSGGASGMAGDPNSMPSANNVTSNINVSQAGQSGGSAGSPNGDSAAPSGMSMMMHNSSPPSHSSSDLNNINATPYPLQSDASGPHPGEYVESPPPMTYSDKPKPQGDNASKSHDSLAEKRGHNWSLPSTAKLATPVSRTIHIECRGDCLILKPDFGNPQPRTIAFGPRTADSVDKLVAAVWDYTKGWGIAGRQMYWKPRLELELGLSGEGRYSELQSLLKDSGLEVSRKQRAPPSTTQLR